MSNAQFEQHKELDHSFCCKTSYCKKSFVNIYNLYIHQQLCLYLLKLQNMVKKLTIQTDFTAIPSFNIIYPTPLLELLLPGWIYHKYDDTKKVTLKHANKKIQCVTLTANNNKTLPKQNKLIL